MTTTPDYEAFAKDVMRDWQDALDVDASDLQEMAIKHGLLYKVEGGFDPQKHTDADGCAEPGDNWYMQSYGVAKP